MSGRIRPGSPTRLLSIVVMMGAITSLSTGCRDYGGHGAEQATYDQIRQLHRVFGEELLRARADLRALEQESAENEDLQELADSYGEIVREHEAYVEEIVREIEGLSPESDYRHLSRVYGAAVSRHRTVQKQYTTLLEQAFRSSFFADTLVRMDRPYSLIPPYFRRIQNAGEGVSVNDVMAAARSGLSRTDASQDTDLDTSVVAAPIPSAAASSEN